MRVHRPQNHVRRARRQQLSGDRPCPKKPLGSRLRPLRRRIRRSLSWLLDRVHVDGIEPKTVRAFNLNLTDLETSRIALYTLVVIPAVAALAGVVVWWRRRR